jgi:hypothetical protein
MFLAEKVRVDSWKTGEAELQLNQRTEIRFTNNTILITVFCLASGPAPEAKFAVIFQSFLGPYGRSKNSEPTKPDKNISA